MSEFTLITAEELGQKTTYTPRYIMRHLIDYKLFEGVHYVRPFGGKKVLFIWERILEEMKIVPDTIPLTSGGTIHG